MSKTKRTIVVGLKSHNHSREMLLRLLSLIVIPGDNILAVHVQDKPIDSFDPNTFQIHEDICKSKQVDFQVKVCAESPFPVALAHEVRLHFARMVVLGCSSPRPKDHFVVSFLKTLPPTCFLLIIDNGGRIVVQKPGNSQQGCARQAFRPSSLSSSVSTKTSSISQSYINHQLTEPLRVPSSKLPPRRCISNGVEDKGNGPMQVLDATLQKQFQKLAVLEMKGVSKHFTSGELQCATNNFSPQNVIGEGSHIKVFRGKLKSGQAAAVKLLDISTRSAEELLQEVEIVGGLQHEHIIQIIGYCYSKDVHAVVYDLQEGSLKQKLTSLTWNERMKIAIGVAKSLEHLHHYCSPPIIHRDVKSSKILLSQNCEPRLSDFGTAMVIHQPQQPLATAKPFHVVGTFGYLAPEYMMYGKVDEKIDVYSYGVVLLELITGKEAIQKNAETKHESLVLWARSLLTGGLWERLIDPNLGKDLDKNEMQRMLIATRLCLMHSSSRRPNMTKIRKLLEEPQYPTKLHREREEFINGLSYKDPNLEKYF